MSQGILERLETKLDTLTALVRQSLGGEVAAQVGEHVAPITVSTGEQVTVAVESSDPYAGVDKDGVAWDARIHSKAKEPKSETTGKWKKRKGLAEGVYDTIMAELKATPVTTNGPYFWVDTATNVSNTCETRAEMDELLTVPTTKELTREEFDALILEETTPVAPRAPLAPKAPLAPLAPVANPVKTEVLNLIKELTTDFQVEPNNITGLMVELAGHDTIGKISDEGLVAVKQGLTAWGDNVEAAQKAITAMETIAATHGLTDALNEGIEGILEPHDADRVGIVHYSAIAGVNDQLQAYLITWQAI